jgi:hypothetical protein
MRYTHAMRISIFLGMAVFASCAPDVAGTYSGAATKTEGGVIFPDTINLSMTVTPECVVSATEVGGPPFVFGGEDPSQQLVLPGETGDCSYGNAVTAVWDADPPLTPAGLTAALSLTSDGTTTLAFFSGNNQGTYSATLTPAP